MVEFGEADAVRFLEKGGKWQNRQILLGVIGYCATSFQILLIVFTGYQPNFVCLDTVNNTNSSQATVYDDKCGAFNVTDNTTSTCIGGYVYDVESRQSIVSEWDLVCDKAYFSEITQMLYTIGMGVGSIFAPQLSDRIGRKWTYLGLRVLNSMVAFSTSLSPNVYFFMAGRFLIGTFGMGLTVVLYVSLMENIPARLRPFATVMIGVVWCLAVCMQAGIAYLMRYMSWRNIQIVMSIPTLTFLFEMFLMKESIRWLYANNKATDGSTLLKSAMKMNGIKIGSIDEMEVMKTKPEMEIHSMTEDVSVQGKQLKKEKISVLDIFRNRVTRAMSIKISIAWFVNSLVYYAIFFMSDSFTGDRYLNFFINGLTEMPAYPFLLFLLTRLRTTITFYVPIESAAEDIRRERIGCYSLVESDRFSRKRLLVVLHALCALALMLGGILMVTLKDRIKYIIMMAVSVIGKFVISLTFSGLYVYTSEVYPTNFRTSGVGLGSASARVGALLSPFANVLARELPWGPGILFGGLCLIIAVMFVWAPETKDEKLPQSMLEIETLLNQNGQGKTKNNNITI